MKKIKMAILASIVVLYSSFCFAAVDTPVSCTGSLKPWDDMQRGRVSSEIEIAYHFYMDPRNSEGSFEERRGKLDKKVEDTFKKFISERTKEYESVRCTYRGIDWNQGGRSSWKAMTCQPGFQFDRNSLKRTMDGDWKGGPRYAKNDTQISWKTGGHGKSKTFAELDAVYANIKERVIGELNSARHVLHDRGIPTDLPK